MIQKVLIILALTFAVFNAFAKIPDQTILCKASIFPAQQRNPQMTLSFAQTDLPSAQLKSTANFQLYEVTYKEKFKTFYPHFVLLPRAEQSSWEKEIIITEQPVDDGNLQINLERFDQDSQRQAGMSLEVRFDKSFNASYLLDPKRLGTVPWITIPRQIGNENILLTVICEYR